MHGPKKRCECLQSAGLRFVCVMNRFGRAAAPFAAPSHRQSGCCKQTRSTTPVAPRRRDTSTPNIIPVRCRVSCVERRCRVSCVERRCRVSCVERRCRVSCVERRTIEPAHLYDSRRPSSTRRPFAPQTRHVTHVTYYYYYYYYYYDSRFCAPDPVLVMLICARLAASAFAAAAHTFAIVAGQGGRARLPGAVGTPGRVRDYSLRVRLKCSWRAVCSPGRAWRGPTPRGPSGPPGPFSGRVSGGASQAPSALGPAASSATILLAPHPPPPPFLGLRPQGGGGAGVGRHSPVWPALPSQPHPAAADPATAEAPGRRQPGPRLRWQTPVMAEPLSPEPVKTACLPCALNPKP